MTEKESKGMTVTADPNLLELRQGLMALGTAEGDPTSRMIAWIAAAAPEDWADLWAKLPNLRDNADRVVRVHSMRVAPSDFDNELGLYVIAEVTWTDSGERGLLSVSSQMCLAQLVALQQRDYLPADLRIVVKKEATKAGFHPIHFEFLGKAVNGAAAAE